MPVAIWLLNLCVRITNSEHTIRCRVHCFHRPTVVICVRVRFDCFAHFVGSWALSIDSILFISSIGDIFNSVWHIHFGTLRYCISFSRSIVDVVGYGYLFLPKLTINADGHSSVKTSSSESEDIYWWVDSVIEYYYQYKLYWFWLILISCIIIFLIISCSLMSQIGSRTMYITPCLTWNACIICSNDSNDWCIKAIQS